MHATRPPRLHRPARHRGFSLVEILVGVVIGLVAVLVIYQVFAVSEGLKRNTTAAGDAQTAGLFTTFLLGQEIGNGGAGLAVSGIDLATCTNTGDIKTLMRPVPVLITDGGADDVSDNVVVFYTVARTLISPALFGPGAFKAGADFVAQSPNGFDKAGGDLIVAIDGAGKCAASKTSKVSDPDASGLVTIEHSAVADDFSDSSVLMNFGPANRVQKVRYDIDKDILRSQSLLDSDGQPSAAEPVNPVASNIALLKIQYGVETNNDGIIEWVRGSDKDGPWDPATVMGSPQATLAQIRAVRIGVIVRTDQPVTKLDAEGSDWQAYVQSGYNWTLFDCSTHDAKCVGRLTGTLGAYKGQYFRYRTYEQVIPLRNAIWNK
ncbi:MAG: PilW family protein [Betaproteobacteria bacterium]